MKIVFDLTKARNPYEGITQYISEIYKRLVNNRSFTIQGQAIISFKDSKKKFKSYYEKLMPGMPCSLNRMFLPMRWIVPMLNSYKYQFSISRRENHQDADIRVFFHNFIPHIKKTAKYVLVIHDLTPLYDESISDKRKRKIAKRYKYSADSADLIFTDSQFVKDEIVKKLNVSSEKITVNYCGVDTEKFGVSISEDTYSYVKRKYHLPDNYILFVGQARKNKNLENLIRAYSVLPQKVRASYGLVLANHTNDLQQLSEDLNISENVVLLNGIDAQDLTAVYKMASCVALISFSEGFGLPLVEGMAAGVPVICSTATCLPEIVGNAGVVVDPYDVDNIAAGLEKILSDTDLRARLKENGYERIKEYNWDKTAEIFGKGLLQLNVNE